MKPGPSFSDILKATAKGWCKRKADDCVLSLALPLHEVDPLKQLALLAETQKFRFLWDAAPGFCLAAAGNCQTLDLLGPRRFELAQRFCDATFGRLTDLTPEVPSQARPRILLAFSFFEQNSERNGNFGVPPAVQSVLPRWQLTRQGHFGWLRLNGVATNAADARELAEKLWLKREDLIKANELKEPVAIKPVSGISAPQEWQNSYRPALIRGIDLVNSGVLKKIVLAVRQSILLEVPLDPLAVLARLRQQQAGSCRFLWHRSHDDVFFGASPERLLSLQRGQLCSDALAGTARRGDNGENLLRSEKDLREHELVVASITKQLMSYGLNPQRLRKPRLARHGNLLHLHTPIVAAVKGQLPLYLADVLHPTPAVAGLPRREAMSWLRTLEPFERGSYAAPIGWIDSSGNAEFRVAIRCGNMRGNQLELTAGAGLVRGSDAEQELEEVGLKLAVLANQFDSQTNFQFNSSSNRSIT